MFKIVSEGGVSAGVRRIEALTGDGAFEFLMKNWKENSQARAQAGLSTAWQNYLESSSASQEVPAWIEQKKEEIKSLEREIRKLKGSKIDLDQLSQKAQAFKSKSGVAGKLITADLELEDREVLAQVTDHLKNKIQSGVVIVVGQGQGSHPIIVSVSSDLTKDYKAGDLLKEVAGVMGGKGGGRPDFAQGAAPHREKIAEAFQKVQNLISGIH